MADVKRTVQVDVSVTGTNKGTLGDLALSFTALGDAVKVTTETVNTLKTTLDTLKVPDNLTAIVNSIKEVSNIKVPNIKQIAQGFERLAAIKQPPDLSKFADEARKFNDIKVPNIKQLAQGLQLLTDSSLSMTDVGKRLRIVQRNLKGFSEINVPNISKIAKGLQELNLVAGVNTNTASLTKLVEAVQKLNGIKVPNLNKLVESLQGLGRLDLDRAGVNIEKLAKSLNAFAGSKVPAVSGLVTGLERLIKLDVDAVTTRIKALDAALKLLDKQGFLKSFSKFASDLRNVSTELGKAQGALNNYSGAVKKADNASRGFGERVKNYFQYRLIADAVFKIKEALMGSWEAIRDYDQALKDLQAITGATSLEVEQMGDTIKNVASTTKFSASEVAEGMRIIGQAGFSAAESVQTMQAVSDLATGTLSAMATTVDLVTTAMRVFKIDASESASVADVFANAVNRSKLTIDKLRTSFNYVGPIARDVGVSFKEMSAAMMTLANSGLRASTIGTGLRRVFAELADPSSKMTLAAQKAGVALADLDPKSKGLKEVIANLGLVLSDTSVAFDIFGKRGAAAALALTDSKGQFNVMLDTVGRSGIAAQQAAKQMEGLGVSFKNLNDKIKLLAISIGEAGVGAALKLLIDIARQVVDAFNVLLQSTFVKFVIQAGLVTGAIWGIVAALRALEIVAGLQIFITMARGLTAAVLSMITLEGVAASMLIAFNPLVVLATAFAVALGVMAVKAFDAGESSKKMSDAALRAASEYGHLIKAVENYTTKVSSLDKESREYADANKDLREDLLETASGLGELSDEAEAAANSIDPLTGLFNDQGDALRAYSDALKEVQLNEFVNSLNGSFTALHEGTNQFSTDVNYMKTSLGDLGEGLAVGITDFADTLLNSVIHPIRTWKGEVGGFSDTLDVFKDSGAIVSARDFANAINDGSANFQDLNDYVESFRGKPMNAQMEELSNFLSDIKEKITPVFEHLRQVGKIDTSYTVEEMGKILTSLGLNEEAVSALLVKFEDLKKIELGGFSNIVEKWQNELKDTSLQYDGLVKTAIDAGLKLTEAEKAKIKASEEAKKELIGQLEAQKALRDDAINEKSTFEEKNKAWAEYYKNLDTILNDAKEIQRQYSEDTIAQDVDALQRLVKNRDEELTKANKLFGDDAAALQKQLFEINRTFAEEARKITEHIVDPRTHLADTKVAVKAIKEEYAGMYKEIELAVLTEGKSRIDADKERRVLSKQEAEKIVEIWVNAEAEITKASFGQTDQTRSAAKARLDAQYQLGKLTLAQVKEILDQEFQIREDAYDRMGASREVAYAAYDAKINQLVAEGAITYESGEIKKLSASLRFYEQALMAAKSYKAGIDKESQPEEYQKALQDELAAEEELYKAKSDALEDYNNQAKKLSEDLIKDQRKLRKEEGDHEEKLQDLKEKNAEKLIDIEDDYADTIRDINYDLYDKLQEFEEKRVELARKYAEKRADIEEEFGTAVIESNDDIDDELDKIRQRGMKEKEKIRDNEKIAARELGELESRLRKAREEGNEEEIDSILDRTDKIKSLYASMADTNKAKRGLEDLKGFKEDVLEAGRDISLDKLQEEEDREKAKQQKELDHEKELHTRKLTDIDEEHAEKLTKAEAVYNDAIDKEGKRHSEVMENIRIEAQASLDAAIQVAKAQNAISSGQDPKTTASPSSGSPASGATAALEQVKQTGNEVSNVLDNAVAHARSAGIEIEAGLGGSLTAAANAGKKGFEEFVVVTDETGRQIITTASTMAQGFTSFGQAVSMGPLASVQNLKSEIQSLSDQTPEAIIKVRTDEGVANVRAALDTIREEIIAIGDEGNGLSIIGPQELAKIDEAAGKLDFLFEGLNTEEPKQKLQDMITTLEGMGATSGETQQKMVEAIQNYANSIDGVDISTTLVKTREGWGSIITVVDDAGAKIEGLSDTIQSNPLDLFPTELKQEIVKNIEDVDGVMENLREKIEDEVELKVDVEQAKKAAVETIDAFHDAKEQIGAEPIPVEIEISKDGQEEVEREVEKQKEEIAESDPATLPAELDTENITEEVEAVKTEIESIEEVEPEVKIDMPKEELENLIEQLKQLENKEITVTVNIVGLDDVTSLVKTLEQLNEMHPEPTVEAKTEGKDKVDTLTEAINKVIGKTVTIVANVVGMDRLKALRAMIDSIKSKTVTVTTIVRTVQAKEAGGIIEPEHYAGGGDVFRRLTSRYIGSGSGTKDDVPAMLMRGEFVLKQSAVAKYGRRFLEMLNSGMLNIDTAISKYASGGFVSKLKSPMQEVVYPAMYKVGGHVDNAQAAAFMMGRQAQLGANPNAPLTADGVTYNINAPSFHNHVSDQISKIKSSDSKKRAISLLQRFTSLVPKFAQGGNISQLESDFANEKQLMKARYQEDVRYARESGDEETAYLLELEALQLEELANTLQITLAEIRIEYEQEMIEARRDLEDDLADFQDDKDDAADDYRDSLSDLNDERADIEREYYKEKQELQREIDVAQKTYDNYSKIIQAPTGTGYRSRFQGTPEQIASAKRELDYLTGDLSSVESQYARQVSNNEREVEDTEDKYTREIDNADNDIERSERYYKQDTAMLKSSAQSEERGEKSTYEIEAATVKLETAHDISKSKADTQHNIIDLGLQLQLDLLHLRQQYDQMIREERERQRIASSSTTSTGTLPSDLNVQYWLNRGGPIGYPRGKKRKEDNILAMLTPGEFVLNEDAVMHYGHDFIEALNNREVDPDYDDFPSFLSTPTMKRTPTTIDGVTYHVNAPSFHDSLAKSSNKLTTDLGRSTASSLIGIFSSAVPHLADGGDIGNAEQQMTFELGNAMQEYEERIRYAKESGQSDMAYILEQEKIELQMIAEDLRYTLQELKMELDYALMEAQLEFESTMLENKIAFEEAMIELAQKRAEAKQDYQAQKAAASFAKSQAQAQQKEAEASYQNELDAYNRQKDAATYSQQTSGKTQADILAEAQRWADSTFGYFDPSRGAQGSTWSSSAGFGSLEQLAQSGEIKKGSTWKTWGAGTANSYINKINEFEEAYRAAGQAGQDSMAQLGPAPTPPGGEYNLTGASYSGSTGRVGSAIGGTSGSRIVGSSTTYSGAISSANAASSSASSMYGSLMSAYAKQEALIKEIKSKRDAQAKSVLNMERNRAKREYANEKQKALREAELESKEVSLEAEKNYRDRQNEMINDMRLLEAEMAKTLFDIRKQYSTADGQLGIRHFLNRGGPVGYPAGYARGIDSVPAQLTPGEYVVKEDVVQKLGVSFFERLNNMRLPSLRFSDGGLVPGGQSPLVDDAVEKYLGRVDLGIGNKTFETRMNQAMAKDFVKELKRMGLSIA